MAFHVNPLNENLRKIAREELNEVEDRIEEDIATLRKWIEQQPHLRANTDPQYLLAFLRGTKHSLEKAKSKIEHFYTIKTLMPEFFKNKRMDKKFCEFARSGALIWMPLPEDSSIPHLVIVRFQNFDSKKFKLADLIRYDLMGMEKVLYTYDYCIIGGHTAIYDFAGVPLEMLKQLDIVMLKKVRAFIEKGVPLRFIGTHVINFPKAFLNILNFLKRFIGEKHNQRMYVHENIESLHDFIPKEYLPKEYGGTNSTVSEIAKQNEAEMVTFNDFLIADDKYGVDEHLKPNNIEMDEKSLFGLEGSFRKLQID